MHILCDKKGAGYIWPCVLVLALVIIFSVVLWYSETMTIVETTIENTEMVLDSVVMKNSTEIYDSIKQGNDFIESFDENYFLFEYSSRFSLDLSDNKVYNCDEQGETVYYLTNPNVTYKVDDSLKLKVSYTLYVPVRFAGKILYEMKIPLTVTSSYTLNE